MTNSFIVHHNPNSGRYSYRWDPTDASASARALLAAGVGTWVAGNCRHLIRPGDLLLFKFGGARLRQEPGLYAAAHVTRAPIANRQATWELEYRPDSKLTRLLIRSPVVGRDLVRVAHRSFGASIQMVHERGRAVLRSLLGKRAFDEAPRVACSITHGLLILKKPLDQILSRTKTWEIRGKATARRGSIALIESKSGKVVGVCEVIDVVGPLSLPKLQRNARRAGGRATELYYQTTYAWVVRNASRLPSPIPYRHPQGAVIWVRLEPSVVRRLEGVRFDA